ncbi:MAG: rhodanese-like domain-containing protein [Eubacteriales bacterium]
MVYCRSGRRSAEASQILVKNGYQKVFNLEGGIMNWSFEVIKQQVSSGNTIAA